MGLDGDAVSKRLDEQHPDREVAAIENGWLDKKAPDECNGDEKQRNEWWGGVEQHECAENYDAAGTCERVADGGVVACED